MIFVTVGSQKFQFNRLLKKIDELIENNTINEEVFAQIGLSNYTPKNYKFVEFISQEEFKKNIEKAELIITHAGTGSIINSIKAGKKVIGIPRLSKYGEHVDDHQIQLINEFKELNFIEAVYDINNLKDVVNEIKNKEFEKYCSNTDVFINNIEEFISE